MSAAPIVRAEADELEAALRRDNTSLRIRTRVMEAALTALSPRAQELTPTPIVMAAYGQGDIVANIVTDARTLESLGDVPAIRFIRCRETGEITGIELAALRTSGDEIDPGFRVLALVAEMAVVS